MSLTEPAWLLLLVPIAIWFMWTERRARRRQAGLPGSWSKVIMLELQPLAERRMHPVQGRDRQGQALMLLLLWSLLAVALAGPKLEGEQPDNLLAPLAGRVLLIDLSSGLASDALRLTAAPLLDEVRSLPTAIVATTGNAFDAVPLTMDRGQIERYLRVLEPALLPVAGRAPGLAFRHGEALLQDAAMATGQVVLITGGQPPALDADAAAFPRAVLLADGSDHAGGDRLMAAWESFADEADATLVTGAGLGDLRLDLKRARDRVHAQLGSGEGWHDLRPWLVALILLVWLDFLRSRTI